MQDKTCPNFVSQSVEQSIGSHTSALSLVDRGRLTR